MNFMWEVQNQIPIAIFYTLNSLWFTGTDYVLKQREKNKKYIFLKFINPKASRQ